MVEDRAPDRSAECKVFLDELSCPDYYRNLTKEKKAHILSGMKTHGLSALDIEICFKRNEHLIRIPESPYIRVDILYALFLFGCMSKEFAEHWISDIAKQHQIVLTEEVWFPFAEALVSVSVEKQNDSLSKSVRASAIVTAERLAFVVDWGPRMEMVRIAMRNFSGSVVEWLLAQGVQIEGEEFVSMTDEFLFYRVGCSDKVDDLVLARDIVNVLKKRGIVLDRESIRSHIEGYSRTNLDWIETHSIEDVKYLGELYGELTLFEIAKTQMWKGATRTNNILAYVRKTRADINYDFRSEQKQKDSDDSDSDGDDKKRAIDILWKHKFFSLNCVLDLMSAGSFAPEDFDDGDESDLEEIATNEQSAHVPIQVRLLRSTAAQVRRKLQEVDTSAANGKYGDVTQEKNMCGHLENLSAEKWETIKASVSTAADRSIEEVRSSVTTAVHRVCNDIRHGGLVNPPRDVFRIVCYGLTAEFEDRNIEFDFEDDVLVPLAQQLLYTANKDKWGDHVCPVGTMNDVLQVLEGKIILEDRNVGNPDLLPGDLDDFKELLEKVKDAESDHTLIEAQQRLIDSDVKTELQEIYDLMVEEPESYTYAVNQLRGVFFRALRVEFAELLAKHTIPAGRGEDEPEHVTEDMEALIVNLGYVANVFTDTAIGRLPESLLTVIGGEA